MSLDARPPAQQIRSFSAESYAPRVPRPLESHADLSNKKPSEAVQFCTCGFEGYNEGTRQKRCILPDPRPLVLSFFRSLLHGADIPPGRPSLVRGWHPR